MKMVSVSIENLYPALAQCFGIICCGYFAGRTNLISETEAKGINTFVGTFALPSLIFMSLAELDLTSVNWMFMVAILATKSIVFFTVIVVTLSIGRPVNYGRAGIFAIFCTQSNDFAVGYPIVAALYEHTHPEFASYLYLLAPISLAILNPIGIILMEIQKRKTITNRLSVDGDGCDNRCCERFSVIASVTKSIIKNPIIVMTVLGILGNWVFKHHVPVMLAGILKVLGSAFSASALFLLGQKMVGKVHKLRGRMLVVPGILIMVKLLALSLIAREISRLIVIKSTPADSLDYSTYGFFYGTFPAAPTVFVFATQYQIEVDLIASAMVACTFISAPLMFVSAKMITIANTDPSEYLPQLNSFSFDISIAGVIVSLWVLLVLMASKKIHRLPHRITAYLVLSQLLSNVGTIMWNLTKDKQGVMGYVETAFFIGGVYSSRLWTAFLAISLLFLQCRSLCFVLKLQPYFFLMGFGLPIVLTLIMILVENHHHVINDKSNLNFQYGTLQCVISASLLILCFIVTLGCLILHERYSKLNDKYMDQINQDEDESKRECTNPNGCTQQCGFNRGCGLPTIDEADSNLASPSTPIVDIEDLTINRTDRCPSGFGCHGPMRQECENIIQQYQEQIADDVELIEEDPDSHDPQILRHIVLLIFLLCSMFVGFARSVWTIVEIETSGISIEMYFIDATLNFGQSIITFAIFGTSTNEIVLPIQSFWRRLWYGAAKLSLPSWHELNTETTHICDQFVHHHLNKCREEIAQDKRWRIKVYKDVFSGSRFVDWLIEVGLARDRTEAVNYGRNLIEGRILRHINEVYHFYDRNLLYTFN